MVEEVNSFSKGNWIVHCNYGIGQIKKIEKKRLDGQTKRFFKVQTNESTYWLPVDRTDYERVRHIGSKREIRHAIKVLKNPPLKIKNDPKVRKAWIEEISSENSITSLATIVRQLHAWQKKKKLNASDQEILERNQKLFLQEWSLIKEISVVEARSKLLSILEN